MNNSAIYVSYVITEIFCIFFSIGIIIKSNKNVGTDLIPTISVCRGCAVCRSGAITATQLIAQADEKLYVQKEIFHSNRNGNGNTA